MKHMEDKYDELGATIMLRGIKENELLEKWEYRSKKNFSDVRAAAGTGVRKGRGKFEHEAACIGLELRKVLKPRKEERP